MEQTNSRPNVLLMHHQFKFRPNRKMPCGDSDFTILVRKTMVAFYPHVRTYGPQILIRVLPVNGPQLRILHVVENTHFNYYIP